LSLVSDAIPANGSGVGEDAISHHGQRLLLLLWLLRLSRRRFMLIRVFDTVMKE